MLGLLLLGLMLGLLGLLLLGLLKKAMFVKMCEGNAPWQGEIK
jgi:hypothetical protein